MKDRNRRAIAEVPPMRVGTRHVAQQHAVRPAIRGQLQRQMADERLRIAGRDQRREGMVANEARDDRSVTCGKRLRRIDAHGSGLAC